MRKATNGQRAAHHAAIEIRVAPLDRHSSGSDRPPPLHGMRALGTGSCVGARRMRACGSRDRGARVRRRVARTIALRVAERHACVSLPSTVCEFIVAVPVVAFPIAAAVRGYWCPPRPKMQRTQRARFPPEVRDHVRDATRARSAGPLAQSVRADAVHPAPFAESGGSTRRAAPARTESSRQGE